MMGEQRKQVWGVRIEAAFDKTSVQGVQFSTGCAGEYAAADRDPHARRASAGRGGERRSKFQGRCTRFEGDAGDTTEAGSYPDGASWCGALDVAGRAFEWVADWFGEYPSEGQMDSMGPASGRWWVLRGGAWLFRPRDVRGGSRGSDFGDVAHSGVGFRWPGTTC